MTIPGYLEFVFSLDGCIHSSKLFVKHELQRFNQNFVLLF